MSNKFKNDLIGSIGLVIFSCVVFFVSLSMQKQTRAFPMFISLALGVSSLVFMIKCIYYIAKTNVQPTKIIKANLLPKQSLKANFYPIIASVLCFLFMLFFQRIRFEISAFGLVFFIMLLINWREAFSKIYIAIIVPVFLLLIFYYGLKLRIPLLVNELLK